ncbi:hypothetical protein FFLO_05795 [Filobasidium floriforme]|uniref:Uncharacterized protein n=1 Tax=Filobasidium floriforme TaxID=5210 RepID=A0A8K0NR21_9TREE|nr:hypothetical protein FFLO_05795 [Filobasidium floriforme]
MHYPRCVQLFGPLSGFGTWAFERNNGVLANINHNGREVDIASTCLRRWILESRLAAIINNPAPNATDVEIAALKTLLLNRIAIMGTLMLQEARGNAATRTIRLPVPYQKGRPVDLHLWDAYAPLLSYLNAERPEYRFIDAAFFMDPRPSLPTRSQGYRIYTHAVYNGFKFCSSIYSRGQRNQYALATKANDGSGPRHLCQIHIFLSISLKVEHLPDMLNEDLVLVEFFDAAIGTYPWQHRDIDLGIRINRATKQGKTLVPLKNLKSSVIVTPLNTRADGACLASVSCDTEGREPEFWLDADSNEELPDDLFGNEDMGAG